MHITLVTGGARSGKSAFAEGRARAVGGDDVTFIATALATDPEMERRIARHRSDRPAAWHTIDAPTDAGAAIAAATTGVILLDCLTLLVANAVLAQEAAGEDSAVAAAVGQVEAVLGAADARDGHLIVVTNEVGSGIVPEHALARWFRDAAGRANQCVAAVADEVVLLVSGIPLLLHSNRSASMGLTRVARRAGM